MLINEIKAMENADLSHLCPQEKSVMEKIMNSGKK